jgi:hypothetical protein
MPCASVEDVSWIDAEEGVGADEQATHSNTASAKIARVMIVS